MNEPDTHAFDEPRYDEYRARVLAEDDVEPLEPDVDDRAVLIADQIAIEELSA